jgi:hypothetical protein
MTATNVLNYVHGLMESEGIRSGQRIDTLLEAIEGYAEEEDVDADQDDAEDSDEEDEDEEDQDEEQNPDDSVEDDPDSAD